MIEFKDGSERMKAEWSTIHPDLRMVLQEFDTYCQARVIHHPVLTEIVRTPAEQLAIYLPYFKGLQAKALQGKEMSAADKQLAATLKGKTEIELAAAAKGRFSWHLVRCATDIRTRTYAATELVDIAEWFKHRCPRPQWEVLVHNLGSGNHLHVGRRDFVYRQKFHPLTAPEAA